MLENVCVNVFQALWGYTWAKQCLELNANIGMLTCSQSQCQHDDDDDDDDIKKSEK